MDLFNFWRTGLLSDIARLEEVHRIATVPIHFRLPISVEFPNILSQFGFAV